MRKGYNTEIVKDGEKHVAICLGADYVSEHEWGIDGILNKFGIKGSLIRKSINSCRIKEFREHLKQAATEDVGYLRRKATEFPSDQFHQNLDTRGLKYDGKTLWFLCFCHLYGEMTDNRWKKLIGYPGDEQLHAAWNDSGFIVASENKLLIEKFKKAFEEKDVAIFLSGGGPFQNAGLKIAIYSETEKLIGEAFTQADKDSLKLYQAAVETGIYEKLESAGKKFYALSPKFLSGELKFWLNPQEQHIYDFGWYTVEELKQWCKNQGPVIKAKKK